MANKFRIGLQDKSTLIISLVLLALTLIAFIPSLFNDFMPTWDDGYYVTDNPMIRHLNLLSIKQMFTTPVNGTYVPLPLLSYAIEYRIFGLNPLPYHITNLILHLICTLLVFQFIRLIIRKASGSFPPLQGEGQGGVLQWEGQVGVINMNDVYAAFGALLFAIHPMHVESVAWITERKDLLYSLFYFSSMILYIQYQRNNDRRSRYIVLSLLFFILSLFSKIQAVALPLSLLLIDYWLERPLKIKLILEKIPYFILSIIFGIAGVLILRNQGALTENEISSFSDRIFYGLYSLTDYIFKFFIPYHQSTFYPYPVPQGHSLPLLFYLNPVLLLALALLIYRTIRSTRAVVFGTLFFLFNVVFLLQILSAGYAFLADRFTYIPYCGLCFIMAWGAKRIAEKKPGLQPLMFIVLSLVIILFGTLTFNRCKVWKNGETLWTDVIEKYPVQSASPYVNRGLAFWKLGQTDKEIADFSMAIRIKPDFKDAYYNRGNAYLSMQEWDKAIADYSMTINIDPEYANAWNNRGYTYAILQEWEKAIADYSRAIELNPDLTVAYTNREAAYKSLNSPR